MFSIVLGGVGIVHLIWNFDRGVFFVLLATPASRSPVANFFTPPTLIHSAPP
jgi:hypothetical protein